MNTPKYQLSCKNILHDCDLVWAFPNQRASRSSQRQRVNEEATVNWGKKRTRPYTYVTKNGSGNFYLKELTRIQPRVDSIWFLHQLFLFQVVPSRERWELLSIKISCSCSFFLQIYLSIVYKFKVIAITTTTYKITFVVYANFWIRNCMPAYENF